VASFVKRMIGAAKLDASTYEEVEADRSATGQALAVVVLSALAAGIGSAGHVGAQGPLGAAFVALIAWFIWAGLIYLLGAKLFPEPQTEADMGQLLRTTGFASAPGVLRIFGFLPLLGRLISVAAALWMLAAMVVAVRQALDYRSTGRAVLVCLAGFLVYIAGTIAVALSVGIGAGVLGSRFAWH
jgi:hypothetical protein